MAAQHPTTNITEGWCNANACQTVPNAQRGPQRITPHIKGLRDLRPGIHPCYWLKSPIPITIDQCRTSGRCRRVEDIHPTLPNPYTFLSVLPPERVISTVLDLKDAFFSLPLAPASQSMFVFKWMDPEDRFNGQLTGHDYPKSSRSLLPSLMSPP